MIASRLMMVFEKGALTCRKELLTCRSWVQHFPSLVNHHPEQRRSYGQTRPVLASTVPITYIEADGTERQVEAKLGANLLDVAHDNDVELEGACGGELACSTCHLVFEKEVFDSLPEMEEEEEDMLDLAMELTDTSRLGCQIIVKEEHAGMKVRIPDDGF